MFDKDIFLFSLDDELSSLFSKNNLFNEVVESLEKIDESVKIKHLPRKTWTDEMVKNKILLWQVPRTTAIFIYTLVRILKPNVVLEFGTSGGYSALWFAKALEKNYLDLGNKFLNSSVYSGGIIHTIEFSDYRANIAETNFVKSGLDHIIKLYRGKIKSFINPWNGPPIDFLFIDADKPHYLEHFMLVEDNLSSGSVVLADNILDNPLKVKDFVDYMFSNDCFFTTIFDFDNGLLFAIKK